MRGNCCIVDEEKTMICIKNYTEMAVKAEVNRHKAAFHNLSCWCDLCTADVTALSLTTLPPQYCLERTYGLLGRQYCQVTVVPAVEKASARVLSRPKHRPGWREAYLHSIRMVNFALEEGSSLVRAIMLENSATCACPQCQADTLALALNRFPPLYGVEFDGICNLPATQRDFFRHDLSLALAHATKTVTAQPHH
jgi:hypothetical protein